MSDPRRSFPSPPVLGRDGLWRERAAWTGGSDPRPLEDVTPDERDAVAFELGQAVLAWLAYHGGSPDADTLGILLLRARYDAHATYREPAMPLCVRCSGRVQRGER